MGQVGEVIIGFTKCTKWLRAQQKMYTRSKECSSRFQFAVKTYQAGYMCIESK